MAILRDETFPIRSSDDIVKVRQMTREWALMQAFSPGRSDEDCYGGQ